ncbi:MFS general substrate transporter [Polychaeton citri CBS 116435]|uniref:MFS general substrate transporter n=1 Tax=Polychaeton citri CBS 116435 TaxID=1314669 RepID=A0A9P4Q8C2_9PEZI|nr:MFS general substrate transporter [Polychaeton citri CBS 116435]
MRIHQSTLNSKECKLSDVTFKPPTEADISLEDVKLSPKKLLLKIDLVVLPLIVLTSTLAFLDKNGMAYAEVWGMSEDANLKGQEYSWLGSIFYFGYLAMEFPLVWLLTKVRIGKFIGSILTAWGICLCCMAACSNFAGLATIRFLLGVFEAGILPSLLFMNSMWYRKREQPLRTALWYNTFAGIFGGILSFAIGKIHGSLATWKYIFLIYGAVTVGVGILVICILPDEPQTAWFFTMEEKRTVHIRLAENQTGIANKSKWKIRQVTEALADPKYWVTCIFVVAQSITNAGITNFNPLVIRGFGFSQSKTTLMATPQAGVAFVAQIIATAITFYVPNIRCLLWVLTCLPALCGAIMVHTLDIQSHRSAALAGVYLMGFYNVPWVLMLSLQSSNTAGSTKKGFVSTSVAVFYAVGNIIGPQFFLSTQAPHYNLGIGAMLCCFAIMAVTGIAYGSLCVVQNRRKDTEFANRAMSDLADQEEDLTDIEIKMFRYVY